MPKPRNTKSFHAVVQRGKNKGALLFPHVHEDGCYVVSPTRFKKDYLRVSIEAEIRRYLLRGLKLRMSNIEKGILATSHIDPSSIYELVRRSNT